MPIHVRDAAATIWGIARDMASPSHAGTSLNAERAIKSLTEVIHAFALEHAQQIAAISLTKQLQDAKQKTRDLQAELKRMASEHTKAQEEIDHLRSQLGNKKQAATSAAP